MVVTEERTVPAEIDCPAGIIISESAVGVCEPSRKTRRSFARRFWTAFTASRKRARCRQRIKTAQDWRDEAYARNPWWGNGF